MTTRVLLAALPAVQSNRREVEEAGVIKMLDACVAGCALLNQEIKKTKTKRVKILFMGRGRLKSNKQYLIKNI